MHHFPEPKRNGGKATIPACRGCHDKIDRYRLETWGPRELFFAFSGVWDKSNASERIVLAKLITLFSDATEDINKRKDSKAVPA
jgi:hypothetical protein